MKAHIQQEAKSLHLWVKRYRFLRAVPIEQGESSIALLLLLEADHSKHYPSLAGGLVRRLVSFTKRLSEAVEADDELRSWIVSSRCQTSSVLRCLLVLQSGPERLRAALPSVTGALAANSLVSLSIGGLSLPSDYTGCGRAHLGPPT